MRSQAAARDVLTQRRNPGAPLFRCPGSLRCARRDGDTERANASAKPSAKSSAKPSTQPFARPLAGTAFVPPALPR
jgi:hypothetical protein